MEGSAPPISVNCPTQSTSDVEEFSDQSMIVFEAMEAMEEAILPVKRRRQNSV